MIETGAVGMDVVVNGIGTGVIIKIRVDSRGEDIYTVALDDTTLTPDGLFYARDFELRRP